MKQYLTVAFGLILAAHLAMFAANPPHPAARPRGEKREDVKSEAPEKDKTVYIQKTIPETGWVRWDTVLIVFGCLGAGVAGGYFWPHRTQKNV